jgi:hypothetical protein
MNRYLGALLIIIASPQFLRNHAQAGSVGWSRGSNHRRFVGANLINGCGPWLHVDVGRPADGWFRVGIADLHGKQVVERQRLGQAKILLVNSPLENFSADESCIFQDSASLLSPCNEVGRLIRRFSSRHEPEYGRSRLGGDQFSSLFQPLVEQGQKQSGAGMTAAGFAFSMRRPLWDYCKRRFARNHQSSH